MKLAMNQNDLTRRDWLWLSAAGTIAAVLPAGAPAKGPDLTPAWPQENGPFGNFNPRQYRVRLVDDLNQARRLWISDETDLGRAKGSASGYVDMLADLTTHPGSSSSLIVADGKVFASSFRPRGNVWADRQVRIAAEIGRFTAERQAALRRNTAIDADDLTLAIDLRTGRTVWKTVEEGRGINRASGKRLQFHGTPVYHEGRVFSLGTMGRVYCYDAVTGRKQWQDDTGSLVRHATAMKERLLRDRNEMPGGEGMGASPIVAGGVLVVPQFGAPAQDVPLRGMSVETGRTLWEVPAATSRYATPAVWTHNDRQYILAATIRGEMRLIDPRSGRVLWTVNGLTPVYYPLSPSATHVMVNIPSATEERRGLSWGRMAAYRLSPERAERAWAVPDRAPFWFENHMDICAMRRVQIRDGKVYYYTQGKTENPRVTSHNFHILDDANGNVLHSSQDPVGSPQFYLVEDRILYSPDAAHFQRIQWQFYSTDPRNFRRIGELWTCPHGNTTAYEVFIELPYVDGLFLMRGWAGNVVCYDLRAR